MKRILLSGVGALLLSSCSINVLNNTSINPGIAFEVLKQETYGGPETESKQVISSQADLNELYKKLGWNNVPTVDFNKNNVVALFMGQKNTGGYSISVRKVSVTGDTATVFVKTTTPEGMATMALSAPYSITIIPKTSEVIIED